MWRKKGTEAYDSGDLEKAVFAFKRSIQCEMEFQERMEVHLALSKAYFERRDYQDSISTCDKVLELPDAKVKIEHLVEYFSFMFNYWIHGGKKTGMKYQLGWGKPSVTQNKIQSIENTGTLSLDVVMNDSVQTQ